MRELLDSGREQAVPIQGGTGTRVLYISYDGLMEPLGQSQVLQYLKLLAAHHQIVLVTFEKSEDWSDVQRREALLREVRDAGILWRPLRYHRSPSVPATAYDIGAGLLQCAYLVRKHRIQVVHARSYVPSIIARKLKQWFGVRFLFDMRGFWPDERVDGGGWSRESRVYRTAKRYERQFLTEADCVVSLTHSGVAAMREFPYLQSSAPRFEVIPTCTNLDLFQPGPGTEARPDNPDAPFTLGYVGSVGSYYLLDEMIQVFAALRRLVRNARFRIINRGQHALITNRLAAHGISLSCVDLKAVEYGEVPQEMRAMDAAVILIKPVFSKRASAPTKLGELLACGVPCLGNAGVGDMETVLEGVGVVLREFTPAGRDEAIRKLVSLARDPATSEACVRAARRHFSLREGADAYSRIYRTLARADYSVDRLDAALQCTE